MMNLDLDSGAESAAESDDLRATLTAAFRASSGEPDTAPIADVAPELPAGPTAEPVGETAEARAERLRDPQGRFAKADGVVDPTATAKPADAAPATATAAAKPGEAAAPAGQTPAAETAPEANATPRAPVGWSPAAKAAFDTLPAEVRDAVAKREAEVNKGFEKLADYKGLDEFVGFAKRNGMTPSQMVENYRSAEVALGQDFTGGVAQLCRHYEKHPFEVAAELIGVDPRGLANLINSARAAQGGDAPPPAGAPPAAALPREVTDLLSHLSTTVNGIVQERTANQTATAESTVDGLFNDPAFPYAHNLQNEIALLIKQDVDAFRRNPREVFTRAYDQATYLNAETRELAINGRLEARTREQAASKAETVKRQSDAAAAARQAAGSITGSPASGAAPAPGPTRTLREELAAAMQAGRV